MFHDCDQIGVWHAEIIHTELRVKIQPSEGVTYFSRKQRRVHNLEIWPKLVSMAPEKTVYSCTCTPESNSFWSSAWLHVSHNVEKSGWRPHVPHSRRHHVWLLFTPPVLCVWSINKVSILFFILDVYIEHLTKNAKHKDSNGVRTALRICVDRNVNKRGSHGSLFAVF